MNTLHRPFVDDIAQRIGDFRVIEDRNMVNMVEDWSRCRSPSRAKRRRRQGHPQRMFLRAVPKPEIYGTVRIRG